MGCCGNNVGVGMSGDAAFQNRKKKKSMRNIDPSSAPPNNNAVK